MQSDIKYFTVGNALTASRLVLLPVIIAGIALKIGYLAVIAMGLALLTDLLDGRISRRLNQASEFGGNLDSSIDFIFLHLLFIAFYAVHIIHTYQFIVIYVAMLMTLAGQFTANLVAGNGQLVKTVYSKATGAFEYLYLLFLVIRLVIPDMFAVQVADLFIFSFVAVFVALHICESAVYFKQLGNQGNDNKV